MDEMFLILLLVVAIVALLMVFRSMQARSQSGRTGQTSTTQASRTEKAQIAEDIKATQTSRVVDAVSILEDLGKTSPGYRQYCELIGTAQLTSSVTAPYSKREVAYYDLRAFRVENIGGREVETLIAHEKSIDPFFFMDDSCDTPVYIDLDSFGDNIILVNSANRMEGPNSDFARAISGAMKGSGGTSSVYAIVGELKDKARDLMQTLRERFELRPSLQPAFAGAGGWAGDASALCQAGATRHEPPRNIAFAGHGHRPPAGGRPGGPGIDFGFGNIPGGLGGFLGSDFDNIGGPHGGYWRGNGTGAGDMGTVLLGMGLGALLGSLTSSSAESQREPVTPQSQFRGYRIVEDVVPLGSQIYALGELYKNGPAYYMGRSVSTTYASSYFATKPEAEVIAHLNR